MATITGTFAALAGTIMDAVRKTLALLEKPDGTLVNAQGNASGHALVEVSGGTVTATVNTASLATSAKQDLAKAVLDAISGYAKRSGLTAMGAPADSGQIGAGAISLGRCILSNSHATDTVFFQFFDEGALPADGETPKFTLRCAAGQILEPDFAATQFATACWWCASSTQATKTITALSSCQVAPEIL